MRRRDPLKGQAPPCGLSGSSDEDEEAAGCEDGRDDDDADDADGEEAAVPGPGEVEGLLLFLAAFMVLFFHLIKIIKKFSLKQEEKFAYITLFVSIIAWFIHGIFQTNLNEYLPWFFMSLMFVRFKNVSKTL